MFDLNDYIKTSLGATVYDSDGNIKQSYNIKVKNNQIYKDIVQLKEGLQNLRELLGNDFNIHVDKYSVVITLI